MRRNVLYVVLGVICCGGLIGYAATHASQSLIFSHPQTLGALWEGYKQAFVTQDFRTVDPGRNGVTTSEGQSYTMLRAVWMGDKQTFDGTWQWTQTNLENSTHLFSWLWGKRTDGTYGVLTDQSGQNSASDADQDIALSLLLAYGRWQDPQYLSAAQQIIAGIWQNEVVVVGGKPYLTADNVEKTSHSPHIVLNPSYFDFAAYPLFAQADPTHPWNTLAQNSYDVLGTAMQSPLNASSSAFLPPDWIWMDRTTGALQVPQDGETTNFGYDALRVPWRLALDYAWWGDPRDTALLEHMTFLRDSWRSASALGSVYSHSGALVKPDQSPAMYGGTMGYFMLEDSTDAQAIYENKLAPLYNADSNTWTTPLSYYDNNWAWLGLGLYWHLLPNTTANLTL